MGLTLDRIIDLYQASAAPGPGDAAVSAQQHALQCGLLAEQAGAPEPLVAAALLHDLGELLAAQLPASPGRRDTLHEVRALPFLRTLFGPEVLEPIRLHVRAKRLLCARDPAYLAALPPVARASLQAQGGPLAEDEARAFLREPYAAQALQLRTWDDQAHSPTRATPGWWYFRPLLVGLSERPAELLAA